MYEDHVIQNKCCMQRRRQRRAKGAVPEQMFGKPSSTDEKADMNSNMKESSCHLIHEAGFSIFDAGLA